MEQIKKQLQGAVEKAFGLSDFEVEVMPAPEGQEADIASNVALKLAGQVHQAPMVIAEKLVDELDLAGWRVEIAAPGFLNFISPDEYLFEKLEQVNGGDGFAKLGKNISPDEYLNKVVIAEFSDPNPFKVLHVGHLYTSVVGDALARLMEFAGARVVRANFGGDVGLHVAKNMYVMLQRQGEMNKLVNNDAADALTLGQRRAEFMAECYVEGTRAYEDDEQAKAEIVQLNKKIYAIAAGAEPESEVAKVYWLGREWSYDYFRDFYARIGLKFDKYYPESTVAEKGLAAVKAEIGKTYEESDGAVVFRGEPYGLHTRVFINKEGLPTYEAKDVGLILTKWEDYHFDKSVIITGNDIVDYMKVVLKSVEQWAPELPARTLHLTHGNVKLAGGVKMSSRKGNFLKAVDVLEMTDGILEESYGSKDGRVMLAAVKYAFLKNKIGGDSIFDPKESVSMTGNSGPYLQYATVRAKKILAAKGSQHACPEHAPGRSGQVLMSPGKRVANPLREGIFASNYERRLAKKVGEHEDVLKEVVRELAPQKLCSYLYELAQEFSRFYEHEQVVGSEREAERLFIVEAYVKTMEHGLGLLGIEVPEEM